MKKEVGTQVPQGYFYPYVSSHELWALLQRPGGLRNCDFIPHNDGSRCFIDCDGK